MTRFGLALLVVALTLPAAEAGARGRTHVGVHVGGRVAIGYHHDHYRHRAWPYYGYYGHYGHYGYGWPHAYPRPYPVPVYGATVSDLPGAVETDVRPGRATLRVDGESAGEARDFNGNWDVLWLSPGPHELEFTRDGYQTLRVAVDVRRGGHYRIQERLNKGSGIDPRSDAEPTRSAAEGAAAPPDRDSAAGPGGDPGLASGFLTIDASPGDAAVYLDGRYLANAGELARLHGALPVAAGEHSVEVVRPGYRSVTRRVTVTAEEPVSLSVKLEKTAEDR